MNIKELVQRINDNPSTLFIGAGFSKDSGGPGGDKLLNELKFRLSRSNESDFFNYLEKFIGINIDKRRMVEDKIINYLQKMESTDNQKYILSIPWRVILTTNYDRIPDFIGFTLDKNREIYPIIDDTESIDIDRDDRLYCFKIFGDITKKYKENGYMVLTLSDRRQATFRIIKYYDLIKDIAMYSNIIYLGYSFKDEIVFDILKDISSNTDRTILKGYALMPLKPSDYIIEQFKNFNIEWIEGDMDLFVKELKNVFGEIPNSYVINNKSISLDNIGFDISRQTLINIKDHINFINDENFNPLTEDPKFFFEGKDRSYYPFVRGWDFKRNIQSIYIDSNKLNNFNINSSFFIINRQSKEDFKENAKYCLRGSAGSGKTILVKRIAYEWYKKGNPVIFIEPKGYKLDRKAIEGFIEELQISFNKRLFESNEKNKKLRFLMIADNQYEYMDDIIQIFDYLSSKEICIDLFVADRSNNIIEISKKYKFDGLYQIDNTLNQSDLKDFNEHINNIKLDISKETLEFNIKDSKINESFFALMYVTIKEAQKPLKQIIEEEYESLNNKYREIYSLVSALDTLNIDLYINLICKYTGVGTKWLKNEILNGKFNGILQIKDNIIITNHKLISEIIDQHEFYTPAKYYQIFNNIIDNFTVRNYTEEELIHKILIDKLKIDSSDLRLNPEKTIELYNKTLRKLETKLLYHHLARFYLKQRKYEPALKTIQKAKKVRQKEFSDSDTYLQDTEGRIELLKVEQLMEEQLTEGEEIWNHLERAEDLFYNAQSDVILSPHPVQGMALTYYFYAQLTDEYNRKSNYCLLGLSKINYINRNSIESQPYTKKLEDDILRELGDEFDEYQAKTILDAFKNPDGYAYLAEKNMKYDLDYAIKLVENGLNYKNTVWLLRIKIEIIKKLYPYDLKKIDEVITKYLSLNEYDLTLAFEVAKYYFVNYDYQNSYQSFNELKEKSIEYKDGYLFKEENILYEGNNIKQFRGIISNPPTSFHDGVINTTDISPDFEMIPVKYKDIKYTKNKIEDRVYFSIFFTFMGPQAMNVTLR